MERYVIEGGQSLCGEVQVSGAKNAALALLAGSLLAHGQTVLRLAPRLLDVDTMIQVPQSLGAVVTREDDTLTMAAASRCGYPRFWRLCLCAGQRGTMRGPTGSPRSARRSGSGSGGFGGARYQLCGADTTYRPRLSGIRIYLKQPGSEHQARIRSNGNAALKPATSRAVLSLRKKLISDLEPLLPSLFFCRYLLSILL